MRICLNMIVKNEAANIGRALDSVADHISCYAILDTGSTDDTIDIIKSSMKRANVPGVVAVGEFKNFSQARNDALALARMFHKAHPWDYLLLMDADMELVAERPLPELGAPAYALAQEAGGLSYFNARMVRHDAKARYIGATHEYLSVEGIAQLTEWKFKDYATGSNRGNKLTRDAELLEAELKEQPNNPRTLFYLAQTYREAGKPLPALEMYERHRKVSDWDEEKFFSQFQIANIYREAGDSRAFIRHMQAAYNERPSRPEPLYALAKHHREKGENALAWMYADTGSRLPPSRDLLFLDTTPQRWGFLSEKAITGFYQPHTREEGFRCANKLALQLDAAAHDREQARSNLVFYIKPISEHAPSWRTRPLPFTPPKDKYTAMNPSITVHKGEIIALARTVNYVIRPDGSYDMQGDDAIKTTNYMVPLTYALRPRDAPIEIQRPDPFPPMTFPPVQGFEDMRLFSAGDFLHASSTVREQNAGGMCEQWLSTIWPDGEHRSQCMFTPERYGQQYEKNWMPIVDRKNILFMYRPGVVINGSGSIVHDNPPTIATDSFSGGSQLLFWEGGWVGIIHEARMDPAHGYSKRYYQHRIIFYDQEFVLRKVSPPFWFEQRQIEFCAGLAHHPSRNEFLITYSTNDATAMIGSISDADLRGMLWSI